MLPLSASVHFVPVSPVLARPPSTAVSRHRTSRSLNPAFFVKIFKGGSAAAEVGSGMLVEHSGRAPRLEMVSFKKLNKGTLALGVVFKVNFFLNYRSVGVWYQPIGQGANCLGRAWREYPCDTCVDCKPVLESRSVPRTKHHMHPCFLGLGASNSSQHRRVQCRRRYPQQSCRPKFHSPRAAHSSEYCHPQAGSIDVIHRVSSETITWLPPCCRTRFAHTLPSDKRTRHGGFPSQQPDGRCPAQGGERLLSPKGRAEEFRVWQRRWRARTLLRRGAGWRQALDGPVPRRPGEGQGRERSLLSILIGCKRTPIFQYFLPM